MIYRKDASPVVAAYSKNGVLLTKAFDVGADIVYQRTVDYSSYTKAAYCSVTVQNMQGFAVKDNTIFQFRANSSSVNNIMVTIDAQTQTVIQSDISASSDHGDSASFSNEYYDEADDFPLLYVTADTNPAKVYVNRVTTTTSQLVKTLSFPLSKTGYYAALALDVDNNIAYMVGYSEQNYQTDDGGANKTVISKWDLSQLTENLDGSYTPLFISLFERPFIYIMQGQEFHDGMIWIASGGSSYNGFIYALDPSDGALLFTVDTETTIEVEGLAFVSSKEMVVGHQGGTYYKYTFKGIA